MTDKNLKEGDEVSWKWGSGRPSGTVAEVKAQGSLEITSKGKKVHKNANSKNPAVHVEREGNDVVKRANELTKESTTASTPPPKPTVEEAGAEGEGEDKKEAEVGEKRERTESAIPAAEKELTEAEKESGKETKKPKLAEEVSKDTQENGNSNGAEGEAGSSLPKKRGPGRPKKSDKEAKKRDEAAKLEASETISGRTRSKAS